MSASRRGQTRELAAFVSSFPSTSIPDQALTRARQAIADVIGVALAGRRHHIGRTILEYVLDQGGRPVAGIWGGGVTTPELAALANGTFAHAMDFDDSNHPLYGHPSCHLAPAAFAVAQEHEQDFGRILVAYVVGFETDAALAGAMNMAHYEAGFHSTGTIGTVGAAAAAARAMALNTETTQRALGIAASRAAGVRANTGTMTKPLHAGAAAMAGVQAARLAARGWDAHPETLEGDLGFCTAFMGPSANEPVEFARDLGSRWSLIEPFGLAIKPFPSCGASHPAIQAAIAVREALAGERIASVTVGVSALAPRLLVYDRPETGNEGRFSVTYTVAAGLLRGALGLEDFTDAAVSDDAVQDLMARMTVQVDPRHADGTEFPASVRVLTASGREIERTVELARGKNANPMLEDELSGKFVSCAGSGSANLWARLRYAVPETPVHQLVAALSAVPFWDSRTITGSA
jgi:2-methylcitrate dehydratase PrpD